MLATKIGSESSLIPDRSRDERESDLFKIPASAPTVNDLSRHRLDRLHVGVARPDAVHHRQAEATVSARKGRGR